VDELFVQEVKPRMRGYCFIVRFADDFVMGFQCEDDARRVMEVLPKRFAKYGLEIHPEKSRLLSFGKPASGKDVTRGDNTFDFLGFTPLSLIWDHPTIDAVAKGVETLDDSEGFTTLQLVAEEC
jgi:hypothetical protein